MALAPKQKYRSEEQGGKPKSIPTHIVLITMTKEARICNGEKTVSLVSGAGKTWQLYVREWN